MNWADVLIIIVTLFLIGSVLLQQSQDDIKDAFSGEKSELFKNRKSRGLELFLVYSTTGFAFALVVLVIISNRLH